MGVFNWQINIVYSILFIGKYYVETPGYRVIIIYDNYKTILTSVAYSVLPPLTTITLECFLSRADNTDTLYTTVVWHCEIERNFSAPSILSCFWTFTHIFFSIWLAHALGSGIDSKNNKNPYTVISFSLYV
jgi:hypothetical protein